MLLGVYHLGSTCVGSMDYYRIALVPRFARGEYGFLSRVLTPSDELYTAKGIIDSNTDLLPTIMFPAPQDDTKLIIPAAARQRVALLAAVYQHWHMTSVAGHSDAALLLAAVEHLPTLSALQLLMACIRPSFLHTDAEEELVRRYRDEVSQLLAASQAAYHSFDERNLASLADLLPIAPYAKLFQRYTRSY